MKIQVTFDKIFDSEVFYGMFPGIEPLTLETFMEDIMTHLVYNIGDELAYGNFDFKEITNE